MPEIRLLVEIPASRALLTIGKVAALALLLSAPRSVAAVGAAPPAFQEGRAALACGEAARAYQRCQVAATESELFRPAALACQGRAALAMRRPLEALHLGREALAARETSEARLLIADAYRDTGDCRSARPYYLHVLDVDPGRGEALAGVAACGGKGGA